MARKPSGDSSMLKKLFSLLIVLYPILSAYSVVGPLDLGALLCAIVGSVLFITSVKYRIRFPKGYVAFLCYVLLAAVLVTHSIPLRIILYTVLFIFGCTYCDLETLYYYYKRVAIICILFFVIQEIARIGIGKTIPGIFTFMPIIYGDSSRYVDSLIGSNRSASFFLEPSYFAQFLFPLIAFELLHFNDKSHIRNAIILSVITFAIRSGVGVLLLLIIWLIWIIKSDIKRIVKARVIFVGGLLVSIAVICMPEIVLDLLGRSQELSIYGADERYQSSGFIRFFRGYYLYGSLPFINQLFGLNPGELESIMSSNPLFASDKTLFINGIQTILCLYGFVGMIFFLRHLYLMGKNSPIACAALLFCVFFLHISESYFISGRMLLTMILIYEIKHNDENSIYYKHLLNRQ